MGIRAVVAPDVTLSTADRERLEALGLEVVTDADASGVLAVVTNRDSPDHARALTSTSSPLAAVILLATLPTGPGPVAVLSPTGSVTSYELALGAGIASHLDRRVEHLNARGATGSATSALAAGFPGRAAARSAVREWRERACTHPIRELRELSSRPSVIVAAMVPGLDSLTSVITEHPDADIVLVVDVAHERHGSEVARQIGAMTEFALGTELALHPASTVDVETPAPAPAVIPSAVLASDVVHARLTASALELTNRTRLTLDVRTSLGSVDAPDAALAVVKTTLAAGEARTLEVDDLPRFAELTPPEAVMRHWSHESEEVYEGGERRMLEISVTVVSGEANARGVDAAVDASPRPSQSYRPSNGLDFALTSRELRTLVGAASDVAPLPEPTPPRARPIAGAHLLRALATALQTGAAILARE